MQSALVETGRRTAPGGRGVQRKKKKTNDAGACNDPPFRNVPRRRTRDEACRARPASARLKRETHVGKDIGGSAGTRMRAKIRRNFAHRGGGATARRLKANNSSSICVEGRFAKAVRDWSKQNPGATGPDGGGFGGPRRSRRINDGARAGNSGGGPE